METEQRKNVGEAFDLLIPHEDETLARVAQVATFAENALWTLYRAHDPVRPADVLESRRLKEQTGKWMKWAKFLLADIPEGKTPAMIAGSMCPGLSSYVYDAIANHVFKFYNKHRLAYLNFTERLPIARDRRIRFREKAVRIRRDPTDSSWFQVGLRLEKGESGGSLSEVWYRIPTAGKSKFTRAWLDHLSDTDAHPSGGTISFRKGRKRPWQISLARMRWEIDGVKERPEVDPVPDRVLNCWAPADQREFLRCQVEPVKGRPWVFRVEDNDLILLKRRHEFLRSHQGRNYHQSPASAAHGHGRDRAIRGKRPFTGRYQRRVNDWIENRSAAIIHFAIEARCGLIWLEQLSKREPRSLRLGDFPYYKFIARVQQKAQEAKIECRLDDLSGFVKRVSPESSGDCSESVA